MVAMRRRLEQIVAEKVMADPTARYWGYDLSRDVSASAGAIYPLLSRWLERGWLIDGWETREEAGSRPPRRYYEVSNTGARALTRLAAPSHGRNVVLRPAVGRQGQS